MKTKPKNFSKKELNNKLTLNKIESKNKEIEELKATVAVLLARMDHEQLKLANAETTERAI